MRRAAALACLLAAALLPVQAEAARFRSGGRSTSPAPAKSRTVIIAPGAVGAANARANEAAATPQRVPFPPSTMPQEEPVRLRLTAIEGPAKPWCSSDVVVGGFCLLN